MSDAKAANCQQLATPPSSSSSLMRASTVSALASWPDRDEAASTTSLPELDDLLTCLTGSTSDTVAYLLHNSAAPAGPTGQSSPSTSQPDDEDTRHLLLRAKAALLRLSQSAAEAADGEAAKDRQTVLADTLASIDSCLSDCGRGGRIGDCCRLVRRAMQLLDGSGGDSGEDGASLNTMVDDEFEEDELGDASSASRLRSWTPGIVQSSAGPEDAASSSMSSLIPSLLLEEFNHCGRQWMQQMLASRHTTARVSVHPKQAAAAKSPGHPVTKPRRSLIVQPTGSGSVAFKGRRIQPSRHQHQQQPPLVLGYVSCRQQQPQRLHQPHQVSRQRPSYCRVLLQATPCSPATQASQSVPRRRRRPVEATSRRPGPSYTRVMGVVLHDKPGNLAGGQFVQKPLPLNA